MEDDDIRDGDVSADVETESGAPSDGDTIAPGDKGLQAALDKAFRAAEIPDDEVGPDEPQEPPAPKQARKAPRETEEADERDERPSRRSPRSSDDEADDDYDPNVPERDRRTGRFKPRDAEDDDDATAEAAEDVEDDDDATAEAVEDDEDDDTGDEDDDTGDEDDDAKAASKKYEKAPDGFHEDAQKEWENAPLSVRAEATRRISELEQGVGEYREKWAPLEPWVHLAEQHETTVPDALQRYTAFEQMIRQNPVEGLRMACADMGIPFDNLVSHMAGQEPDEQVAQYQQHLQQMSQRVMQAEQQLAAFQRQVETERVQRMQTEIAEFAADPRNPNFDEYREHMGFLMEKEKAVSLRDAYDQTHAMMTKSRHGQEDGDPPAARTRAQKSKTSKAAARTRKSATSRSPTGSRSGGNSPPKKSLSDDPQDDVARAFNRVF